MKKVINPALILRFEPDIKSMKMEGDIILSQKPPQRVQIQTSV